MLVVHCKKSSSTKKSEKNLRGDKTNILSPERVLKISVQFMWLNKPSLTFHIFCFQQKMELDRHRWVNSKKKPHQMQVFFNIKWGVQITPFQRH